MHILRVPEMDFRESGKRRRDELRLHAGLHTRERHDFRGSGPGRVLGQRHAPALYMRAGIRGHESGNTMQGVRARGIQGLHSQRKLHKLPHIRDHAPGGIREPVRLPVRQGRLRASGRAFLPAVHGP